MTNFSAFRPADLTRLIGFELDRLGKTAYPPYNLIEREDAIELVFAVAGFAPNELDVSVAGDRLTITGKKERDGEVKYIHRGISTQNFTSSFVLSEYRVVDSVSYENGLLTVTIKTVIPEEKKPKSFTIAVK